MMDLRTVLIVDDVKMMQEILRTVMKPHCERVLCAANCAEALELLEAEADIELVITDLIMPDGDGYQVLEALQARKGPKPLAILTTARFSSEVQERARALGAIAVISKPIAFLEIERAWHEEVERRKLTRKRTSAAVQIHASDGAPLVSAYLHDLSVSGAFIKSPLPVGAEIELEISLGDQVIRSRARVVRIQEPSWLHPAGSGVFFESMDDDSRATLEQLVQELPELA